MKLEVQNGSFTYRRCTKPVLQSINFTVHSGEVLAILGPNGAGKTTLLRCLMGLLHWKSGKSLLDSNDILHMPNRQLWQMLSYVPQAREVSAAYSVQETILLGRSARIGPFSVPSAKDLLATEQAMERLGLSRMRTKKCSELSGGELQMVLIARALVSQPQVLILDEPESNLDFRNQLLVLDTISDLASEGMLCIFNTHYPAHALRRADKALLLAKDGTYQFGKTPQIVTHANIETVFGVHTVIGEIETPETVFRDIFPVGLAQDTTMAVQEQSQRAIAVVAVIFSDRSRAEQINQILHGHSQYLIGRMGMPYPQGGLYVVTLSLDAPKFEIQSLTDQLARIPGVSVKATYAKEGKEINDKSDLH